MFWPIQGNLDDPTQSIVTETSRPGKIYFIMMSNYMWFIYWIKSFYDFDELMYVLIQSKLESRFGVNVKGRSKEDL